jgi:hypothetical protein
MAVAAFSAGGLELEPGAFVVIHGRTYARRGHRQTAKWHSPRVPLGRRAGMVPA